MVFLHEGGDFLAKKGYIHSAQTSHMGTGANALSRGSTGGAQALDGLHLLHLTLQVMRGWLGFRVPAGDKEPLLQRTFQAVSPFYLAFPVQLRNFSECRCSQIRVFMIYSIHHLSEAWKLNWKLSLF